MIWPAAIAGTAFYFRDQLAEITKSLVSKFQHATKVKIGVLELEGEYFDPKGAVKAIATISGNGRSESSASNTDETSREGIYKSARHLMLSHKIAPSKSKNQKYDISIFLVRKIRQGLTTADFDDVEEVSYYLGKMFGSGSNGSKFVVRHSDNGFAMKTSAYGEALCVAEIKFRDGEIVKQYRFLDFSMGEVFTA